MKYIVEKPFQGFPIGTFFVTDPQYKKFFYYSRLGSRSKFDGYCHMEFIRSYLAKGYLQKL